MKLSEANAATDPEGPTGKLVSWLSRLRLEDVPPRIRERAKALTLDGLACAIVGAQLPWSRTAVEATLRFEGAGGSALIGWGRTAGAPAAALLNGTFIQGFELDDFHPAAPLHSASLILPALFACAEVKGAEANRNVTGAQFLLGAIAGFEVGPRVGLALHGAEMLSRGWHSGSVFGTHAAAAAAGTLLELNAAQFEDALGLAATQSAGLMAAQYEAMSKRMHHGFASRSGLSAAMFAAGGYTGIKRVFERDYGGFLSTFGEGHSPDASQIAADLGTRWETDRIVVKLYAAMGGIHSPLDALFDIGSRRALVPSQVAKIEVDVSHAVFHHGWWEPQRPLTPIGAQMNIGYALAVAVLDGAAMVDQFSPSRIDADDVWSLIPKIAVRHDPAFDTDGPAGRGRARVAVTFTDGERIVVDRKSARSMETPPTTEEVGQKFRALTEGLLSRERADRIEAFVLGLETEENVLELVELLAPPVAPAFT